MIKPKIEYVGNKDDQEFFKIKAKKLKKPLDASIEITCGENAGYKIRTKNKHIYIQVPLPDKKYSVIYADPPWSFNFKNRRGLSVKAKDALYDTMNIQDIISLPVQTITQKDAVLFLWIMSSMLPESLRVMEAWGFKYKTVAFTWVKLTAKGNYHFGGGNWTRSNPELCLLGTRGKIKRQSASVRELVVSPRREHSRKPDEIKESIVQLVGDRPRIELFARQKTEGWDVWGDEV
ncbi:MAG: DNA methyltransferase [Candidatus Dadabacteria bacterium]|nr:DNA methyltransferase [Candidatus Dadabacteria bacterium]